MMRNIVEQLHITSAKDIRADLGGKGYSRINAHEVDLSPAMIQSWHTLQSMYPNLPPDKYLPNNGKYRFRRFGRFYFLPAENELMPLPHIDYFQSKDINKVTGGIVRKFDPLLPEMFNNDFLREIIMFDFEHFSVEDWMKQHAWNVDVHLIRVVASADFEGHPTPEGIHRDGASFVTVHLAELENADGGEVSIYDDDQKHIKTFKLDNILDAYVFNDQKLWHSASPIKPIDPSKPAIRSILTFDYHYRPELQAPE